MNIHYARLLPHFPLAGSMDGTIRVWSLPSGTILTNYYMNIPVMCFQMSFDGSFILIQLGQGGATPLLRLHNSPASEVNSQSQVEVDVNEGKSIIVVCCRLRDVK